MEKTAEELEAQFAYIKLQEDVKKLIIDTVMDELRGYPQNGFALQIKYIVQNAMRDELKNNYRVVFKGDTAPTY